MKLHAERGFTLMELMISLVVFSLAATGLAAMLVDSRTMEVLAQVGSADFANASIDGQVDDLGRTLAYRRIDRCPEKTLESQKVST
jgi:prepilin-type N-terminal cleavage/methylation domain-containing protein